MRRALGFGAVSLLLAAQAPAGAAPSGTGWVYDAAYLDHDAGAGHPESPERLRAIVAHLETVGLMDKLTPIRPTPAALEWVTTIHSPEYVASVERACREGRTLLDAGDTGICPKSYDVALLAVGGVLGAVDAVTAGSVRNAFCAVRPPGHHALKDQAMGFCLFDNVAIGARYVQRKYGLQKVLIVDWDVHHGNGTQAAFYDDPTVLYFSVHRSPFYPGSGAETETGSGSGEGYTVNVPLPAGSGDAEYVKAFEEVLKPKALSFRPDFVFISAGFDAHDGDPLGGMKVTTNGYASLTRIVTGIADHCCEGRVVSVLEGGYNTKAVAESVEAHLRVLLNGG
jgi:acetoin utilization deacetylase AcuC-like enzyme